MRDGDQRWHEAFCEAAHECLGGLKDNDLLMLGLRLRYRLSQREVAAVLGKHEGNLSRQTDHLRQQWRSASASVSWPRVGPATTCPNMSAPKCPAVLLDDPRLSVDHLAHLLGLAGKRLPQP